MNNEQYESAKTLFVLCVVFAWIAFVALLHHSGVF